MRKVLKRGRGPRLRSDRCRASSACERRAGPDGALEVRTLTIFCREGSQPVDDIFAYSVCRQYLLDLLAHCPGPRKCRGRRHPPARRPAVGVAPVIAGCGRSPRSGGRPPTQARRSWPCWERHAAWQRSPPSGVPSLWSAPDDHARSSGQRQRPVVDPHDHIGAGGHEGHSATSLRSVVRETSDSASDFTRGSR
jgi:hypothetical protein